MAKLFLVAGEASGDLHAGNLARALRAASPDLELFGFGGRQMRAAGVEIIADPTRVAVIGLVEVLRHLSEFRRLFQKALATLDQRKPDLVILVDYPGFNLRLAREVKRRGIRLVYYISPQIWAWDSGRIHWIRRLVDRMLVLFQFEKELYEKAEVPVTFVGHPLLDRVAPSQDRMQSLHQFGLEDGLPIIALLPGSREGEIRRILPVLAAACEQMQEKLPSTARFLLIKSPDPPWEIYRDALRHTSLQPKIIERWDYDGIYCCDIALVSSGTATLECALLDRPMLIVYKTSWLTYWISRWLIRIPMIGLVNIVAGRKVVPELLQRQSNPSRIADEALELWTFVQKRQAMREAFREIRTKLGPPGATQRAAETVLAELGRIPISTGSAGTR